MVYVSMMVCPRCDGPLDATPHGFSCPSCAYRAHRERGVLVFERGIPLDHPDYPADGLDALCRYELDHPWFTHRLKIIRNAFATHVGREEQILEVGAGTGHTARALKDDGYVHVALGDMHVRGLVYAKRLGIETVYQFDLQRPPFRDHFDAVALFDVLEHIPGDVAAVRQVHRMLRPGGRVLLTVPAHSWLWSRVDDLSGHHRRYNRRRLGSLLASAGFDVLECRYFFTALVPGLLLRSLLSRNVTRDSLEGGSGLKVSRLGRIVLGLMSGPGDAVLFPLRHVAGGSLIAVARKARA